MRSFVPSFISQSSSVSHWATQTGKRVAEPLGQAKAAPVWSGSSPAKSNGALAAPTHSIGGGWAPTVKGDLGLLTPPPPQGACCGPVLLLPGWANACNLGKIKWKLQTRMRGLFLLQCPAKSNKLIANKKCLKGLAHYHKADNRG